MAFLLGQNDGQDLLISVFLAKDPTRLYS